MSQEEVCLGDFKIYKSYKANLWGDIWTYNFLLLHSFYLFHTLWKNPKIIYRKNLICIFWQYKVIRTNKFRKTQHVTGTEPQKFVPQKLMPPEVTLSQCMNNIVATWRITSRFQMEAMFLPYFYYDSSNKYVLIRKAQ